MHEFGPEELVLLDRDESGLHSTQLSIWNQGLLKTRNMMLCDIRDEAALDAVFAGHQPDVVFHAAALKHLPMLELYPYEGWKTNVLGAANVLECAEKHGAERVINISTDTATRRSTRSSWVTSTAATRTKWPSSRRSGRPCRWARPPRHRPVRSCRR